jgi:DHA3 family macrolide efflux protein-like MFS transporter
MKDLESPSPRWQSSFFSIWVGQQLSLIGSSLAQFALVWWLTDTTGSATVLASGMLVSLLPTVLVGPFAGALVDRWDRRRVMIVADGFIALVSAWLAYLFWADAMQIWHVYVVMLARAAGGVFHFPAMSASTSLMVPKEHLPRVAGLNNAMHGGRNIVSPPLAALLLSLLPLHGIMAIDVATAMCAIVPLLLVSIPQPDRDLTEPGERGVISPVWQDVREGLRYVYEWRGLFYLLIIVALGNFFGVPGSALTPILVTNHFGGGVLELGWMNSAYGVGFLIGGLALGIWGGFRRRIVTMLTGWVLGGLSTLLIAAVPSNALWLALVATFIGGVMNPIANGTAWALLQTIVAPKMQGRVFTVVTSLVLAVSPISMAVAGPIADAWGVRVWYLIGGTGPVLLTLAAFFVPAIMHLEQGRAAQAATN